MMKQIMKIRPKRETKMIRPRRNDERAAKESVGIGVNRYKNNGKWPVL